MIRVSDLKLTMLCRVLPLLALMVMSGLQPSKTMAASLSDAGSCRADVVFLMDNTGSMGSVISTAQRNASAVLTAISGGDSRFAGIDVNYGVATYWGDPREYSGARYWFCARETCPWSWCRRYWCEGGDWPHYCSRWGYCGSSDPATAARKAFKVNQALTDSHALTKKAMNEWRPCSSPGGCGGDWAEANYFALHQLATGGASTDGTCTDSLPAGASCTDKTYATGYDIGWRDDAGRIIVWFGDACSWTTTVDASEATAALLANNVIVAGINTYRTGSGIDYPTTNSAGSCRSGSGAGQASVITSATKGTLTNSVSGTSATVNAILDAVAGGIGESGSAAAVSFSAGSLTEGAQLFKTSFNPKDWSGDVTAYALGDDGDVGAANWNAATQLDATRPGRRVILTMGQTRRGARDGVKFRWKKLTTSQKQDLRTEPNGSRGSVSKGKARLSYLRGNRANEGTGHNFRVRSSVLGDIWHSGTVYVGIPNQPWPDSGGGFPTGEDNYSSFKASQHDRAAVVYVGANDGFLHGFRALDGKEVVAYAPGNLFSSGVSDGYHRLTDPNFNHNNLYVDGTPFVSDAYIASTNGGSESWRTVLVGPQGGGGRGLFALDVTNPDSSSFREGNAANIVMWEFTNSDDAHLGYTQARPTIALLNNGRWAVLTGNGPTDTASDETGGESQLFILYLDGGIDGTWTYGTDYLRIPTGSGSSDARNALMTPAVIDIDGDGTADRVYAGDLNSNLWAFDLSSSDFGDWGIAHGSSPLFTGESSQPITAKPTVIKHPTQNNGPAPNLMILFGTGRFLSDNDKTRTDPQSFYGVWDTGIGGLTRADLVAQTFLLNDDSIGGRVTDPDLEIQYANATGRQYGWYIDLPTAGERVVSRALVRDDIVYFSTIIPDVSVCAEGGTGWEMAVKTENGGSPDAPVFDFNDDNEISLSGDTASITLSRAGDTITEDIAYGGRKLDKDKGMPTAPAFKGKRRYTASTADTGKPKSTALEESAATLTGRLSWEQLFPSQ